MKSDRIEQIHWDASKFSVGHPLLDKQHQTIIGLINQLRLDTENPHMESLINFTMAELIRYADNHLAYEEKIMREAGYPELKEHAETHQNFRNKLEELGSDILSGKATVKDDLLVFLTDWLYHHILEEDIKYKPYMD